MMTADSCDMRYIDRDELDAFVWDEILSLSLKVKNGENVFEEPDHDEETKIIEKEIKSVDEKIMKLMDLYSVGSMPTDLLTSKIQKLNEDKQKLVDQITELETPNENIDKNEILDHLRSAKEIKENGSLDDQRALIFALIDRITINQASIHIKYRFN
jgi:site-specific DNA recombinase